jgi:hypothetical protein
MTAAERLSWANSTGTWHCLLWPARGRVSLHLPHRAADGVAGARGPR